MRRALAASLLVLPCLLGLRQALAQPAGFALWAGASAERVYGAAAGELAALRAPREFEILEGRQAILLAGDGRLYDLSERPAAQLGGGAPVDSIAVLAGALIALRGDRLGYFEEGRFTARIALPSAGLRVVAGANDEIYLFGPAEGGSAIYLLKDWKLWPLLRLPARIDSLTAVAERVFFSVEGSIYTFKKGEKAGLLFVATGEKSIDSLAVDARAGLLYFAAGDKVYAMRAGVAFSVVSGLRGLLRYADNALFVLDRNRLQLIKVSGLDAITLTRAVPAAAPVRSATDFKE